MWVQLVVLISFIALTLSAASAVSAGQAQDVCVGIEGTPFWAITKSGFLSARKTADTCRNELIAPLCKVMSENPTTENIAASLQSIYSIMKSRPATYFNSYATDPADVEDVFNWLSIASCRVAYNQNPAGDKIDHPINIPKELALPLVEYAKFLRREPFVSYSAMVLDNCIENPDDSDPDVPAYTDWHIMRTVTSNSATEAAAMRAEKGFYASHCAVEKGFGEVILTLQKMLKHGPCSSFEDCGELYIQMLRKIAFHVRNGASYLRHMRHFYNPSHFYSELRSYIKCGNVAENGMIFEFENEVDVPKDFEIHLNNGTMRRVLNGEPIFGIRGPSGAGTTSLSSIDAGLQITTSISSNPHLAIAMNEFRQFHPNDHYTFNDALRTIRLRDVVLAINNTDLIDAYNDAIVSVAQFRDAHVEHISTYIIKSVRHLPPQEIKGTGNTPIVKYLCESFFGTLKSVIRQSASMNLPVISVENICMAECITGHYTVHSEEYCAAYNATMALLN